ncbi:NADP-dependent oxidoreductase [Candidatus Gottesmanbacteria bacterium]|nr:NADP-dependent oxidoreductase [Candidatus Gottesmanbacteria bacterium]
MKAVQINKYGGIDVLEINKNATKPILSKDKVLVEVHATSINPADWKIRQGLFGEIGPFPITLGGDFSGVVLSTGDEVYGQTSILSGGSGSFAQFSTANPNKFSAKPKNTSFIEAAALPLVGVSAIQAIEDAIKLQPNQKILIHGGAGGIGHIAIQVAKAIGAYVATTVSGDDINFVKSLGADEVIDYKRQSFEKVLKDFDAVFDTVGGEVSDKSFTVLKKDGIIVSMLGKPNEELARKYSIRAVGQSTDINIDRLTRLTKLVETGKIKVNIDKIFALDEVKEAFEYLEHGHPRGKVVLKIKT